MRHGWQKNEKVRLCGSGELSALPTSQENFLAAVGRANWCLTEIICLHLFTLLIFRELLKDCDREERFTVTRS